MRTALPKRPRSDDSSSDSAVDGPSRLEQLGFPNRVSVLREELLVVVVVGGLVTWVYRLWHAHWRIPFSYSGDGLAMDAYAKSISENGWYLFNPRLAAPFRADWRDFPLGGENIHYLASKILGIVSGSWATGLNLYFVLGFFLIATSAYFVARYLGFRIASSLVVAVLYAFLPYHAYRGSAQLSRSEYYIVPLAVLAILWTIDYRRELLVDVDGTSRFRRGRLICVIVLGLLLGMNDTQSSMFMVSIIGVICVVAALRDRDWKPIALLVIVGVATFGSLLANNAPYLLVRHERGTDSAVANRTLNEQEVYGLRPVRLILPAANHRVGALRRLTSKARTAAPVDDESAGVALGVVGAIGFLFGVGALLSLVGVTRGSPPPLVVKLGLLNLVAVLLGTVGGFAFVLALGGLDLWRTWNRISIFIAYASLLAAAVLLEWLFGLVRRKLRDRNVVIGVIGIVVAVVIVAGVYDQTPVPYLPNYQQVAATYDRDATFYHAVENALPRAAMVFQLPIAWFPEQGPIVNMPDYAEFAAYIQTKHLRWSYGGMHGRPENTWQAEMNGDRPAQLLATITAVGFDGVVIDTSGFADNGAAFINAATALGVAPKIVVGTLQFIDLRPLRTRVDDAIGKAGVTASRDIALEKTEQWTGFSFAEGACDGVSRWATARTSDLALVNPTEHTITTTISTGITANPQAADLLISGPGFSQHVALANGTGSWQRAITLAPGTTHIEFDFAGPAVVAPADTRKPIWQLTRYTLGARYDSPAVQWATTNDPTCATAG
jgi:phosphoglycerol transferase